MRAEDLWKNCDDLLIGLDFSFDHNMIDIFENLLDYFLVLILFLLEQLFFTVHYGIECLKC